jgi:hypothetical protein
VSKVGYWIGDESDMAAGYGKVGMFILHSIPAGLVHGDTQLSYSYF